MNLLNEIQKANANRKRLNRDYKAFSSRIKAPPAPPSFFFKHTLLVRQTEALRAELVHAELLLRYAALTSGEQSFQYDKASKKVDKLKARLALLLLR